MLQSQLQHLELKVGLRPLQAPGCGASPSTPQELDKENTAPACVGAQSGTQMAALLPDLPPKVNAVPAKADAAATGTLAPEPLPQTAQPSPQATQLGPQTSAGQLQPALPVPPPLWEAGSMLGTWEYRKGVRISKCTLFLQFHPPCNCTHACGCVCLRVFVSVWSDWAHSAFGALQAVVLLLSLTLARFCACEGCP